MAKCLDKGIIPYVITDDGKEVLIPAIDEFVKKVDLENNTMTVHLIKGMI